MLKVLCHSNALFLASSTNLQPLRFGTSAGPASRLGTNYLFINVENSHK